MIAWINGIQVQGTPEEIERYRIIAQGAKTGTDFFRDIKDDVPEHVKKYEPSKPYIAKTKGPEAYFSISYDIPN